MRAVILAAGQGTRLRPLTIDRPKGMVAVDGRPIIERQVERFAAAGIDDVVIVTGYQASSVPSYGARHFVNTEFDSTNMVASLFAAGPALTGDILVSYGDILYSEDVLRAVLDSSADVGVVVDLDWQEFFAQRTGDDAFDDAESLVFGDDGNIERIGERDPDRNDVHAQYVGLVRFSARGIEWIRAIYDSASLTDGDIGWGRPLRSSYMTDLLQELINTGHPVSPISIHGGWVEIDDPRDHEIATDMVRRGLV